MKPNFLIFSSLLVFSSFSASAMHLDASNQEIVLPEASPEQLLYEQEQVEAVEARVVAKLTKYNREQLQRELPAYRKAPCQDKCTYLLLGAFTWILHVLGA